MRVAGRQVGMDPLDFLRVCAGAPVVAAMLRAYPGAMPDAHAYGPVCVAAEARGRGLAAEGAVEGASVTAQATAPP